MTTVSVTLSRGVMHALVGIPLLVTLATPLLRLLAGESGLEFVPLYEFNPVLYSLTPHSRPVHVQGLVGNGKDELGLAEKVLSKCGESRFSLVTFGNYLHDAAGTDEERDKVLLAFLYYVNSLQGEDSERGRVAAKIHNVMLYHGYVT